jgi:predicted GNAT superfamily acetyltransferase
MITVRELTVHGEFEEAVNLQRQIWGFADIELLPVRMFVVAGKVGGFVLGAFDGDHMVGFCLAIPGIRRGKIYLHSHMLGVMPGYRDQSVGRQLKLKQREEALSRSIGLIEWTFDPLELKNAYFNIQRLGAVVNRYVLNQYGSTTSHLHGGLPTDRCVAEWWLNSGRVSEAIEGQAPGRPEIASHILVPASIGRLRGDDPARAREIQKNIGERFLANLEEGLTVVGLDRSEEGGKYLFGKWDSK